MSEFAEVPISLLDIPEDDPLLIKTNVPEDPFHPIDLGDDEEPYWEKPNEYDGKIPEADPMTELMEEAQIEWLEYLNDLSQSESEYEAYLDWLRDNESDISYKEYNDRMDRRAKSEAE